MPETTSSPRTWGVPGVNVYRIDLVPVVPTHVGVFCCRPGSWQGLTRRPHAFGGVPLKAKHRLCLPRLVRTHVGVFQTILDETRCDLAKRYLEEEALTLAEVAFLLGFAEPSAFHRAFKRWTGQTPLAFRRGERAA